MVGVVLVTHPQLGEEFIRSAEMICGKMPRVLTVSIDTRKEVEELRRGIAEAIKKVEEGDGVLILTDMFGGTPSNMSLAFLSEGRVEVITGLNLPMLIHDRQRPYVMPTHLLHHNRKRLVGLDDLYRPAHNPFDFNLQ